MRAPSRDSKLTQPENSWPTVSGVASCKWVRPIFTTSLNSFALSSASRKRHREAVRPKFPSPYNYCCRKRVIHDCDIFTSSFRRIGCCPSHQVIRSRGWKSLRSFCWFACRCRSARCEAGSARSIFRSHFVRCPRDEVGFLPGFAQVAIHQRRLFNTPNLIVPAASRPADHLK